MDVQTVVIYTFAHIILATDMIFLHGKNIFDWKLKFFLFQHSLFSRQKQKKRTFSFKTQCLLVADASELKELE